MVSDEPSYTRSPRSAAILTTHAEAGYTVTSEIMAVFKFRRTTSDVWGYYYDRWDRAIPISVTAANQADALEAAYRVSGEPPRGCCWEFNV